ncbi:hypothetical protein Tco_0935308 [Tanacetum coccineum]
MRIDPTKTQKESTYQVVLDTLSLSPCYHAFLITADVPEIYMQQFWFTISKIKDTSSYHFKLDKKKCRIGVEVFREVLQICPRLPKREFVKPPSHEEIEDFMFQSDNKETNSKRRENMPYPRFTNAIIQYFISKDKSISMRNIIFMHSIKNDSVLGTLKFVPKGTEKSTGKRKPTGIVIKDTPTVSKKKTPIQAQKHKGGSSEGAGSKPEVLDKPKGKSIHISEGADDDDDRQSDDERTESDNDKSVNLNKTDDEEESQKDVFVHTPDDYVPTNDESRDVDDEEYDRINDEMYDDVNVELKDAKLAAEGKGDEEMTNAEKVNVEHEEANQEVASAQVQVKAHATTTAAPATQKEKTNVPPIKFQSIYLIQLWQYISQPR